MDTKFRIVGARPEGETWMYIFEVSEATRSRRIILPEAEVLKRLAKHYGGLRKLEVLVRVWRERLYYARATDSAQSATVSLPINADKRSSPPVDTSFELGPAPAHDPLLN